MSFQWIEFDDIAQLLYSHGQSNKKLSEATYRCAISRSYYAAYHHLRIIGEQERKKNFSRGGTAHGEVIDYFSHHSDPTKQKAGNDLLDLKGWRKKSDYVEGVIISNGNAAYSMAISRRIIQSVR